MKKLLLFILLTLPFVVKGQQTYFTHSPIPSDSFTPSFRFTGAVTDSLGMKAYFSNGGKFWQFYSATQVNALIGSAGGNALLLNSDTSQNVNQTPNFVNGWSAEGAVNVSFGRLDFVAFDGIFGVNENQNTTGNSGLFEMDTTKSTFGYANGPGSGGSGFFLHADKNGVNAVTRDGHGLTYTQYGVPGFSFPAAFAPTDSSYITKHWADSVYTHTGGGGVTSFNSRTGSVVPLTGDYASFYPILSGNYANPSWITSLAYSKLTGAPTVYTFTGTTSQYTDGTGAYQAFPSLTGYELLSNKTATASSSTTTYPNWAGLTTALSAKQNTLTFDSTPTSASTNPVTSGGVFTALATKQASLSGTGNVYSTAGTITYRTQVFNEIPTGVFNGTNTAFTAAHTPVTGTVQVSYNGALQRPTTDYTVSGATITFTFIPTNTSGSGSIMIAYSY